MVLVYQNLDISIAEMIASGFRVSMSCAKSKMTMAIETRAKERVNSLTLTLTFSRVMRALSEGGRKEGPGHGWHTLGRSLPGSNP